MNILIISTPSEQGAGEVVFKLASTLEKIGHSITIVSKQQSIHEDSVLIKEPKFYTKLVNRLSQFFFPRHKVYCFFDLKDWKKTAYHFKIRQKIGKNFDLIIVAFHQNFLSTADINNLVNVTGAKIFYWMMDMVEFTGGCHYSMICDKYMSECSDCPAFKKRRRQWAARNQIAKSRFIEIMKPSYISISKYQQNQASSSMLLRNRPITNIYHYIDLNLFNYHESARNSETKTILFCASSINEQRKGFSHLLEAIRLIESKFSSRLNKTKYKVVVIGNHRNLDVLSVAKRFNHFNFEFKGSIHSKNELAGFYKEAYILVCPTLADSGPLTVMEALACGLPIVGYDQGIIHDLKEFGCVGEIVNTGKVDELSESILKVLELDRETYQNISLNCRNIAEKNFAYKVFEENFRSLLETI